MKKIDTVELVLVCLAATITLLAAPSLPRELPLGEIALVASGLLLAQGLVRDLWIKYGRKAPAAPACKIPLSANDGSPATCMCMESSLGIIGIVAGVIALLSGARHTVALPPYFWPAIVLAVGLAGFVMKNLVIDWKARRIRIENDHSTVRYGK